MTRRRRRSPLRRVVRAIGFLLLGVVGGGAAVGYGVLSAPRHEGPVTDHFDGRRFRNQIDTQHGKMLSLVRWQTSRDIGPWRKVEDPPAATPASKVGDGELRVTVVGHATTLVQIDGLNILTDPIWSATAGPAQGLGPRRYRPPAIPFDALPPIHAVVVSHNHYDHMDLPTLLRLEAKHKPQFVVGLGNELLLKPKGLERVASLDWWEAVEVEGPHGPRRIRFVPAVHFSQRGLGDRDGTLWGGFVIHSPSGPVYFAGDTGFGPHFAAVRKRFGPPRLAILPIGAFRPRWFMKDVHIDPAEAVDAHLALGARTSVAMHFGTFLLADDGMDEPVTALQEALAARQVPKGRFLTLPFGEAHVVAPRAPVAPK